jgi:prefoldin subunit 1
MQIQNTVVQSQRSLGVIKAQATSKERERKIIQLTQRELQDMGDDVNVYKGVGKMCVNPDTVPTALFKAGRFMQVPRPAMDKELQSQEKELTDDINNLGKKVRVTI